MVRVRVVEEAFVSSANETPSESEQATDESMDTPEVSDDSDVVGDFQEQPWLLSEMSAEDGALLPAVQEGVVVKATSKKLRVFWVVLEAIRTLLVRKLFGGRSLKPTLVHAVTFLTCFVAGTAGSLFGVIVSIARPSRATDIVDNWTIAKLERVVLAIARSASEKAALAAALVARDAADMRGRNVARVPAIENR